MTGWRAHALAVAGAASPWMAREPLKEIVGRVAKAHAVTVADLKGPSRDERIVHVRRLAMREARKQRYSLPEIGRALNRHHTTVLAGLRAVGA